MATYRDKLNFTYGDKSTKDFNVWNISLDGGMFDEELVASQNINEQSSNRRKMSIFTGIERENLSFEISIAFKEDFDDDKISEIIEWLYGKYYYAKLQFEGSDKFTYAMPEGECQITHTGNGQGYISVTLKTNSPYYFGNVEKTVIDSTTTATKKITVNGLDNPDTNIEIKPKANGTVKITVGGHTVQINKLLTSETVTISTINESIESNVKNVYHYSDFLGDLSRIGLRQGVNDIKVEGNATVTYYHQPYYIK